MRYENCENCTRQRICDYHFSQKLSAFSIVDAVSRGTIARANGRDRFEATCPTCVTATEWDAQRMRCLTCAPRGMTVTEARDQGSVKYEAKCATHGVTEYWRRSRKCCLCFTVNGERRKTYTARAAARKAGKGLYKPDLGELRCEAHPTAKHHVSNGKCSVCFASNGVLRRRDRTIVTRGDMPHYREINEPDNLRELIEAAGETTETLSALIGVDEFDMLVWLNGAAPVPKCAEMAIDCLLIRRWLYSH